MDGSAVVVPQLTPRYQSNVAKSKILTNIARIREGATAGLWPYNMRYRA